MAGELRLEGHVTSSPHWQRSWCRCTLSKLVSNTVGWYIEQLGKQCSMVISALWFAVQNGKCMGADVASLGAGRYAPDLEDLTVALKGLVVAKQICCGARCDALRHLAIEEL